MTATTKRADSHFGTLVIWDKDAGKAISAGSVGGCADAVRYRGRYYWLSQLTKGARTTCLTVRETWQDQRLCRCIYSEDIDPAASCAEMCEARLEEVGGSLFVVMNGKRIADVTPNIELDA